LIVITTVVTLIPAVNVQVTLTATSAVGDGPAVVLAGTAMLAVTLDIVVLSVVVVVLDVVVVVVLSAGSLPSVTEPLLKA
jgi:hypothetical protein